MNAMASAAWGALILGFSSISVGCHENGSEEAWGQHSQKVVYGNDDRMEVYAHPDETLRNIGMHSIVALMTPDVLNTSDPDNVTVVADSLGDAWYLCPDQRFYDQPTAAFCSGTLIDDDLVLTAGHCMADNACSNTRFVFNYYYASEDQLQTIQAEDIYTCAEVVVSSVAPGPDYAIVRLNEAATPLHEPATVVLDEFQMNVDDPVSILGFGSGLPEKIDSGGHVINAYGDGGTFLATTDSFGGNSGSGVFGDAYKVVGILVSGQMDYTFDYDQYCHVVSEFPEDGTGGGESITYVYYAIEALCDSGYESPRLCGGCEPICQEGETQCEDGNLQTCEEVNGCLDWVTSACDPGWSCEEHQCMCAQSCTLGERRCAEDGLEVCEKDDADCPVWKPLPCGEGQICHEGMCLTCNDCEVGAKQCSEDGLQTCVEIDAQCRVWGQAEPCAEREVCKEDHCEPACTSECSVGTRECLENGKFRVCEENDMGCGIWMVETCPAGQGCIGEDGQCKDLSELAEEVSNGSDDDCGCTIHRKQRPWKRGTLLIWMMVFGLYLGIRRRFSKV